MKKDSKFEACRPDNVGWIKYKLDNQEMDYLWRCIDNKKRNRGNAGGVYDLMDRGDWFFTNTVTPIITEYIKEFSDISKGYPTSASHAYFISRWWVNYQKQTQFIPLHNHSGLYSFVIWMKIPYDSKEQSKKYGLSDMATAISPDVNSIARCGNFQFNYVNILGNPNTYRYPLDKSSEGTMMFFPAKLQHEVFPFYGCDEERVSISGNVSFNTARMV